MIGVFSAKEKKGADRKKRARTIRFKTVIPAVYRRTHGRATAGSIYVSDKSAPIPSVSGRKDAGGVPQKARAAAE